MKRNLTFEVESNRMLGRPGNARREVIKNDLINLNANREDARNRTLWGKMICGGG